MLALLALCCGTVAAAAAPAGACVPRVAAATAHVRAVGEAAGRFGSAAAAAVAADADANAGGQVFRFKGDRGALYHVELRSAAGREEWAAEWVAPRAVAESVLEPGAFAAPIPCGSGREGLDYTATVYLEQAAEERAKSPPQSVWISKGWGYKRDAKPYLDNMPTIGYKRVTGGSFTCGTPCERKGTAACPSSSWWDGSWVKLREPVKLHVTGCTHWTSRGKEKGPFKKYHVWRPNGEPAVRRWYGDDVKLETRRAVETGPSAHIRFAGDSLLRFAFMTTAQMVGESDNYCKGTKGNVETKYSKTLALPGENRRLVFLRASGLSISSLQHGVAKTVDVILGRDRGETELPSALLLNSGLWEVQARPTKVAFELVGTVIDELDRVLSCQNVTKIWMLAAPISVADYIKHNKDKGDTTKSYRTNSALLSFNELIADKLAGTDWHVIDSFALFNARRRSAPDGRHYIPETMVDFVNVVWDVIYGGLDLRVPAV